MYSFSKTASRVLSFILSYAKLRAGIFLLLTAALTALFLPTLAQAIVQISPPFGNQISAEGVVVSKQIEIIGSASGPLAFSATGLPPGLSVNPATGQVSGTIDCNAASGSLWVFSVSVADDDGSDFENAIWSINSANCAPTVNFADQIDDEGTNLGAGRQVIASDNDAGDSLTFSISGDPLPTGLSMSDSGLITGTISLSAGDDDPTIYNVTIEVKDSATATDSVTIAWTVNDVPIINFLFGDGFEGN